MTRKKIIVLAFCLVFVIPLTGCRKTSEKSEVAKSNAAVKWFDCPNGDEMVWDGIKEYNLDEFPELLFVAFRTIGGCDR